MNSQATNWLNLVDNDLVNTSLGNWSYVLRALELKVKLVGQVKRELNYEEMLNASMSTDL